MGILCAFGGGGARGAQGHVGVSVHEGTDVQAVRAELWRRLVPCLPHPRILQCTVVAVPPHEALTRLSSLLERKGIRRVGSSPGVLFYDAPDTRLEAYLQDAFDLLGASVGGAPEGEEEDSASELHDSAMSLPLTQA